jgi:hypothetical protein
MFVVRVLAGKSTNGNSSHVKPPVSYHSTVNDVRNPSIYVIYEHAQTYPEYLLAY